MSPLTGGLSAPEELSPSDGATGDTFGAAIAASGDTAVVGAPEHGGTGAAYVFVKSGSSWSEAAELAASDGADGDGFGSAVAISGDTILVGAPGHDLGNGATYVFTGSGSDWTQAQELAAAHRGDEFGSSVAVWGDTALVGAEGAASSKGAIYQFTESGGTWSQQNALSDPNRTSGDRFGAALSLDGSDAVVGAPEADRAYFVVITATGLKVKDSLFDPDGNLGDDFSASVALLGDTAVVGSPGDNSAYYFTKDNRSGTLWSETALSNPFSQGGWGSGVAVSSTDVVVCSSGANGCEIYTGATGNWQASEALPSTDGGEFGAAVAATQGEALVGAPQQDAAEGAAWAYTIAAEPTQFDLDNCYGGGLAISGSTVAMGCESYDNYSGAVYIYVKSGSVWTEQAALYDPEATAYDGFGTAISLTGDYLAIGAPYNGNSTQDPQGFGATYLYKRTGTTWNQLASFDDPVQANGDEFGLSVAVSGSALVVGAPGTTVDSTAYIGAAYVYVREGPSWVGTPALSSPVQQSQFQFGTSVALSGNTAVVGVLNDLGLTDTPGAWVYGAPSELGDAWTEEAGLTPADGVSDVRSIGFSGSEIVLDNYVEGEADVFTGSGSDWNQVATLTSPDDQEFAGALALSGDTLLVQDLGRDSGPSSVDVFKGSGATWTLSAELSSSTGGWASEFFGYNVAISGSVGLTETQLSASLPGYEISNLYNNL